jgi:hypothetical protein
LRLSNPTRIVPRALLALGVLLALAGASCATALAEQPGVSVIAQNGFGERENSYAWGMGWFKGKLYVGTGRDVLCVENETTQFFVPLEQKYTVDPQLNVHCPPNPYEMDLRAQIWQYTPKTRHWQRVYQSPDNEPNPAEPSRHVGADIAYRSMADYTEPDGRQAIYAAGVSADEYLPSLLTTNPPRILRSYDGVHWEALHLPDVVVHYPGGNTRPMGFRQLLVWRRHLYVTATPDLTGDGSLFEITRPYSRHPGLVQVSPPNLDIFEVAVFHDDLYVGCGSEQSGYSVWESSGHGRPFIPIVTGGAGRGAEITSVVSMHVFHDALYVGASGWYQNTLPKSEMIRISPEGQWTLVVGAPRKLPSGKTAYPSSGLEDGFNSLFNAHFWRMASFRGGMYVGTNSWGELVKSYKGKGWLGDLVVGAAGTQVWATCNGEYWYPVTRDAFGVGEYNFGARVLEPNGSADSELFIGTANHSQGTAIIDYRESICTSLVNGPRRVAAPAAMIAESTAKAEGTLLSWKPSSAAVRYEVLAAPQYAVTLWMQPQPTLPNGFEFEGAEPILSSPEAPGAVPVTLSIPGEYESVGTTTAPYFVANDAHRVYEVVAEDAAGRRSAPSNIQVVPAPEPPATFQALRGLLPSLPAYGKAAAAARAHSPSPAQRLLDAAGSAWARGDRAAAIADVRRLQAGSISGGGEIAALAERLERRMLYANVAGAP